MMRDAATGFSGTTKIDARERAVGSGYRVELTREGTTTSASDTTGHPSPERGLSLSVCIPCYSAPATMLQESVASAAGQLPLGAELVVLPNGPAAIEAVATIDVPAVARVVPSVEALDLVTNWNRCLHQASGELIHILHEDDAVAPGFYEVILELARAFPRAALYATASTSLTAPVSAANTRLGNPEHLRGLDAARFFLADDRHACGNVVVTRRAVERQGEFDPEFAYCCDEEAFLRWASAGGVGFHPAPLYRNRRHPGQNRYPDWLRADFVQLYFRSRVEGARGLGDEAVELAVHSTERRVVSVAVELALAGYPSESVHKLTQLQELSRPRRSRRVRLAKIVCRSRLLLTLAHARRRLLGYLRR